MSEKSHRDSLVAFLEYTQVTADKKREYRYQMLQGKERKYAGCVWQNATMKENFKRFNSIILIDAIKRETNSFKLPYVATYMSK